VHNILPPFTWLFLEIYFYKFLKENRDTVSRSKEVADSVYLHPWRTGICPGGFRLCVLFAIKIQFASVGIFSSFGPSDYKVPKASQAS
jgi:hypothetical protein